MQKQKLEILQPREIVRSLEEAFTTIPLVPKDCVKSLNRVYYNLAHQDFTTETYSHMIFLMLRGFTSKDSYLKSMIYSILQRVNSKSNDGIVALNSILKDIEDKNLPVYLKNSAYRTLFTYLPETMKNDFAKLIKLALLNDKSRDNSVCIASEYFKDMKIDSKVLDKIDDYHLSYFNKLPINKYSALTEIRKMAKENDPNFNIGKYLGSNVDGMIFIEAVKALIKMKQEVIAVHVEKAISTLRLYLKKDGLEQLVAMKILNQLSVNFPQKVARANKEIEDLINNSSKTVGMLAILTLLKTGDSETARQLSVKLESLIYIMSESYKMMAIETIEKLSKTMNNEFLVFLKNSLTTKASVEFKRFILNKLENILKSGEKKTEILKFLCTYIEDPEYYQISMDILGIIGEHLENKKDLMHVYNRLILDNMHVRNSAYQTLYNLGDKLNTMELLREIDDSETVKIREFLVANENLKKGDFDLEELGDLKEEVCKYLSVPEKEEILEETESEVIKECRSIDLTAEDSDILISVIKKVQKDSLLLCFTFENKMNRVIIDCGVLIIALGNETFKLSIQPDEFKNVKILKKEIQVPLIEHSTINCVFDYRICLEDDPNETEEEVIQLQPFDVNLLDLVKPVPVRNIPENSKSVDLKFKLKPTDAISKIVGICNMYLNVDKNWFELQGVYKSIPIVITGNVSYSKYSTIAISVCCDQENIIDSILAIFD